jgi:protein-S-isoprenylcysteine O-methyltransferase Ste14
MDKFKIKQFFHVFANIFLSSFWFLGAYTQVYSFLYTFKLSTFLMFLCQVIVGVLFFIRKEPGTIYSSKFGKVLAFLGTFTILLYKPYLNSETIFGEMFISVGAVLLLYSLISLNTSFGITPADRGIKTNGMYKIVRHPIYMSYIIFFAGYYINNPTFHNTIVILLSIIFECARIFFEEKHLSQNPEYSSYKKTVKYRLIPYLF